MEQTFGARLKALRLQKRLSQRELAEKVVRPTRTWIDGRIAEYIETLHLSRDKDGWAYRGAGLCLELDEPDALAVVEKAVRKHLYAVNGNAVTWACPSPKYKGGIQWVACGNYTAEHPDETTALCLLALRVAGEEG